jgi:uncharacterized protein (TIGR03435 family)
VIFPSKATTINAGLLLAAGMLFGQTSAGPAFEVASVKPAAPVTAEDIRSGKVRLGATINGARYDVKLTSLTALLLTAFRLKPYELSGPDWIATQMFDVSAKIPEGASRDQVPEMLQALLVERFKLAVHRENKEQPVYALVVGKGGPKLKEAPPGAAAPTKMSTGPNGSHHIEMTQTPAALVTFLTPYLGRPVLDMTELKGVYQVVLDISQEDFRLASKPARPDPNRPADAASDPSGASFFASVEQLGLKLESRKAPIETIVIDHLEKTPTEN